MKKTVTLAILAGLFFAGCATTGTQTAATQPATSTPITLDQALEQAQTARAQLEQAKTAYQNAKAAAQASKANGTSFETELAKQAIQSQVNETKTKVDNEVQAWKDVFTK